MRAKRTRIAIGGLCGLVVLAGAPWAVSAYRRHENTLACRRAFAELCIERPSPEFLLREHAANVGDDRFSLSDQARTVERDLIDPFTLNRVSREPAIAALFNQGTIRMDEFPELIHTAVEVGENAAFVRVWVEGDLSPKDAAQLTNALIDAVKVVCTERQDKIDLAALVALRASVAKEAVRLAALKDEVKNLNRRIETTAKATRSHTVKLQALLVSKLDEMLVDLKGQRVLLLADQFSTDDEARLVVEASAAAKGEEPQTDHKSDTPSPDTAPATAFKRRLAKLDRKIEFITRSINELEVEPSSMKMLEHEEQERKQELDEVAARVKSLDAAVWSREWKRANARAVFIVNRRAEALSQALPAS